jgi:hypothetical protein
MGFLFAIAEVTFLGHLFFWPTLKALFSFSCNSPNIEDVEFAV